MKRKPISVLSMLLACMLLITGCASQPASSTSGTSSKGDSSISSSESPADDVSSDTDSSQDGASPPSLKRRILPPTIRTPAPPAPAPGQTGAETK